MSDSKPVANLSPTLLARKGGAKPAMRSQFAAIPGSSTTNFEDLGWNDLGTDVAPGNDHGPGPNVSSQPLVHDFQPEPEPTHGVVRLAHESPDFPVVLRHRPEQYQRPVQRRSQETRQNPFGDVGRRAAFTLRLDAERHLKLRLACTLRGCSAQQLVTDALDRLLEDLPEVCELASRVTGNRH